MYFDHFQVFMEKHKRFEKVEIHYCTANCVPLVKDYMAIAII